MLHTEAQEQTRFAMQMNWLLPDILWYAIPNGGYRNPTEAARLKDQGVKKGVADVFVAYPKSPYHGLYIEFKTPTGKFSKEQQDFKEKSINLGYKYLVAHSGVEAFEIVNNYIGITKNV